MCFDKTSAPQSSSRIKSLWWCGAVRSSCCHLPCSSDLQLLLKITLPGTKMLAGQKNLPLPPFSGNKDRVPGPYMKTRVSGGCWCQQEVKCCGGPAGGTYSVTGLQLGLPQEPVDIDAVVGQFALEGGRLAGRHRHVLQRPLQADDPGLGLERRHGVNSFARSNRSHGSIDPKPRLCSTRVPLALSSGGGCCWSAWWLS